jgi:hypothetical protein
MDLPRFVLARQRLHSAPLADVPAAAREAVAQALAGKTLPPGSRVAVTAGSRGIRNIDAIVRAAVEALRGMGAEPFVVPAMGSHGGATAEGQSELLAETYGIAESTMGCPVLSTMEVVKLGGTPERDLPVYVDAHVAQADGILVINRVKPHTDFSGPWESGLMKMIAIGLGKRAQAESIHAFGAWGLRNLMPEVARAKLRLAPILGGLAILEDAYDQTSEIVGLPAATIEAEEPRLLDRVKRQMARLPFEDLDLLIVDRLGKEISGTGMDTNVIGRKRIPGEAEFERPRVERIVLRDLTPETHGNAIGIGLADVVTQRLADQIDWPVTNTNSLVSGFTQRSMLPTVAANDREALETALFLLRRKGAPDLAAARIRDTLHLEHLWISESLLPAAQKRAELEVLGEPEELRFDADGNLLPDAQA